MRVVRTGPRLVLDSSAISVALYFLHRKSARTLRQYGCQARNASPTAGRPSAAVAAAETSRSGTSPTSRPTSSRSRRDPPRLAPRYARPPRCVPALVPEFDEAERSRFAGSDGAAGWTSEGRRPKGDRVCRQESGRRVRATSETHGQRGGDRRAGATRRCREPVSSKEATRCECADWLDSGSFARKRFLQGYAQPLRFCVLKRGR